MDVSMTHMKPYSLVSHTNLLPFAQLYMQWPESHDPQLEFYHIAYLCMKCIEPRPSVPLRPVAAACMKPATRS